MYPHEVHKKILLLLFLLICQRLLAQLNMSPWWMDSTKLAYVGMVANWFSNYLSAGSKCVQFAGCPSSLVPISKGMPQSSILGPLLLSIC